MRCTVGAIPSFSSDNAAFASLAIRLISITHLNSC
jgi:hypothetical protein